MPTDNLSQIYPVMSTSMVCLKIVVLTTAFSLVVNYSDYFFREGILLPHSGISLSHVTAHNNCQVVSAMEKKYSSPLLILAAGMLLALAAAAALHQSFHKCIASQNLALFKGKQTMVWLGLVMLL